MQLYRFLCIVTVLAVSAKSAAQNGRCSVPLISNGYMQEAERYNNKTLRFENYRNVSVGTLSSDNTRILLVCDEGYTFQGASASRVRIRCFNGHFSPDPVCLKRRCSVPLISNGYMQEAGRYNNKTLRFENYRNVSVGTLSSDTTRILLVCDDGYTFEGAWASRAGIRCLNGQFSPDPVCLKPIYCPPVDKMDDLYVVYKYTRIVNSVARFSCKDYNKRISPGSDTWTCLPTGNWSGGKPECKETCSVPLIPNGYLQQGTVFNSTSWERHTNVPVGWSVSDNTTFMLFCDEDHSFKAAGASTVRITCLNGQLSPDPVCLKKTCSAPLVPNGNIQELRRFDYRRGGWTNRDVSMGLSSSDNTTYNTFLLVCDDDYSLQGAGVSRVEITCSNGQWSSDPVCLKSITCPAIDEKDVFIVVYNNGRAIHSTARFYCKDLDQEIVGGDDTWTCLPTRNWSGDIPECKVSQCMVKDLLESDPEILVPNLEKEKGEMVPVGVELPLLCRENLILVGSQKAKCGRKGKWRYGSHQCVSGCHLDPKSLSPQLIIDPVKQYFLFGEYVDLSCPIGMKLSSNVEMLMCMGSIWSDEIPECQ